MKLNEREVADLEAPAAGNKVYYFPDAVIQGAKVPRGFGVRVTAGGARSFVLNYRAARVKPRAGAPKGNERRFTIGQWPDWSVLRAVQEARGLRRRVDRGEDPLEDRRKDEAAATDTLQAICEEYMRREGGKLRSADWREAVLERLVYPRLGGRPIGDIKRSDIVRLLDTIEEENGPVMADRTLAVVRKIMNWHASRSDEFRTPIVRGMARTKPKERTRRRTLSDDELRAVWRAAASSPHPFGALVRFILLTGARRTEAAGMTRSELDGGDWTLPAARNKTKVDLVRPLSKQALAALPTKADGCDFVFSTDGETSISGFSKFKLALDKESGTAGWTLHDLRRTARSLMSRAGVSPDHAEHCLGHVMAGVRGTYDRHEYYDEKQRAFVALASQIERIVNPQPNVTPLNERRKRQRAGA
jgi:integrase